MQRENFALKEKEGPLKKILRLLSNADYIDQALEYCLMGLLVFLGIKVTKKVTAGVMIISRTVLILLLFTAVGLTHEVLLVTNDTNKELVWVIYIIIIATISCGVSFGRFIFFTFSLLWIISKFVQTESFIRAINAFQFLSGGMLCRVPIVEWILFFAAVTTLSLKKRR